ncbi:L-glyceraldehyde 3-phosphate reductase [Agarivorans sp. QJM3NY_33]|uniref:L-glyceraldehyde 3-phosphate reductase n=1 Tax=Agarivorans sp. QJM3NY_33 TaxID=3421432 RepID=UPI003D7DB76D
MITTTPNPIYVANPERYQKMQYQRCGQSGVQLPRLALGLWQNFGSSDPLANARNLLRTAFDLGINHFDLANNYGPSYGAAEQTFGKILQQDLAGYRDELFISSKAGYDMWPGPYGSGGSRKYLVSSCDQSLKRTGLDYFDVFYHHRPDPETPLEETMQALDYLVRSGRALYIGISNYSAEQTEQAAAILKQLGTPLLIHQPRYNLFDRWIEDGLCHVLKQQGIGSIVFSPLAQGVLTDKYLNGIPENSRASRNEIIHLKQSDISAEKIAKVAALNQLAEARQQSLAQMAIAWTLSNDAVTTCLIGASRTEQLYDSVKALDKLDFSTEELSSIEYILAGTAL